jgi:phosphohistidine phosphatase
MHPGLQPFDRVKPIAKEINRAACALMIVGHEPFLGRLASRLVVGRASKPIVELDKPSIVCLIRNEAQEWRVHWMLSPQPIDQAAQTSEQSGGTTDNPDSLN